MWGRAENIQLGNVELPWRMWLVNWKRGNNAEANSASSAQSEVLQNNKSRVCYVTGCLLADGAIEATEKARAKKVVGVARVVACVFSSDWSIITGCLLGAIIEASKTARAGNLDGAARVGCVLSS